MGTFVTVEDLKLALMRKHIAAKISEKRILSCEEWEMVMGIDFVAMPILQLFIQLQTKKNAGDKLVDNEIDYLEKVPIYLESIRKCKVLDAVYDLIESGKFDVEPLKELIAKMYLFSGERIRLIAENGNVDLAISLLIYDKKEYTTCDVKLMWDLISAIKKCMVNQTKNKIEYIFRNGKSRSVWVCQCGTKNLRETIRCTNCHRYIYGSQPDYPIELTEFIEKVQTLEELLK